MSPLIRKSRLARTHRWLGVALSPVIALMLLSGIVLAARPWLASRHPRAPIHPVDVQRLITLVARVDSSPAERLLFVNEQRTQFSIGTRDHPPIGPFDITTGARVAESRAPEPTPDLFDRAGAIHNDLGIRQGWLVALASVALVLVAGIGPFLSRGAGRGTILGRHVRTGWLLMPLALYLPATLVMMRMDLPQRSSPSAVPVPVASALRQASAQMDMSGVMVVQTLRGWTFIIASVDGHAPERYRLKDGMVAPLKGRVARLGYTLHEGAWGGPVGGIVNALAALVMLWMLGTGLLSAWRRTFTRLSASRDVRAAA